ncbi:MAG TPA: MFS transporter [Mycobacteriales bacterium]|nr:MFS transporter [Mycobacteriales bacterium]
MTAPLPLLRRRAVEYGALPIAALAMVQALQNGEATSLSFSFDGLKHDFHVSDAVLGTLPFAMAVIGLLGAVPFGILADRWWRKWLLAGSMAVWTACMGITGAATGFLFLAVARFGVGIVEANSPAAISLLADYYPVKDRAGIMARYQLGGFLGAILAGVVGGIAVGVGGWRWVFYMWIPFGIVSTLLLFLCKEPARGEQDADFGADLAAAGPGQFGSTERIYEAEADHDLLMVAKKAILPPPRRTSTVDYDTLSPREVLRELRKIPSMWYGVISITVAQLLLSAMSTWAFPYFQRVHHLSAPVAGGVMSLLSIGAAAGILTGGMLSDRFLQRGWINGRVWLIAIGSVIATVVLMPGFASTSLQVTAPLFFIGGFFITMPIAPSEAMVADVVVCELRGRAATVRSIVRTLSSAGGTIVGVMIGAFGGGANGTRLAIVWFLPIFAIGGLLVLLALRSYGEDLAFVLAEAERTRGGLHEEPEVIAS